MEEMILRTKGLTKHYKSGFSLQDVNINLPRGYIMGFIGPNGAGKSTTIKLIMNLIRPDAGEIELFGLNLWRYEEEIKNRIGYVGEQLPFYEEMTVDWTARFVGQHYRQWDEALLKRYLSDFQIDPRKKVKQLSKGMRVKLALALALAHRPELLILDEPTSGLDPLIRREILQELLAVIQDDQRSIFFSSHITEDIEKIADYVTFIQGGRILLTGEKEEVRASFRRIRIPEHRLDKLPSDLLVARKLEAGWCYGITNRLAELRRACPEAVIEEAALSLDDILAVLVKGEM